MATYAALSSRRSASAGVSLPRMKILNTKELISKFSDPDPDIRYMSLCDLESFLIDDHAAAYLVKNDPYESEMTSLANQLIHLLRDPNGEVQNQALK
ncbi:hypothetical protein KEM54_004990, partial [Ascosphaera aggregata]